MEKAFRLHIEANFPGLLSGKFLLACSGGLDSVVLAHLCHHSGLDFCLAHCDFQLRGEESDGDREFTRELAAALGKEIVVKRFDTQAYARKKSLSIQEAARELRYEWFFEILEANSLTSLVLAHHADDALETFLINLSRGTGIAGLRGIVSHGEVLARPLLIFQRQEILDYAQAMGYVWREDSSNSDIKYLRNKIRQQLIPVLKGLHPSFEANFNATQRNLQRDERMLNRYRELIREELFEPAEDAIRIELAAIRRLEPRQEYLHFIFAAYGFTDWPAMAALIDGPNGKEVLSPDYRLIKTADYLVLKNIENQDNTTYHLNINNNENTLPFNLDIQEVERIGAQAKNILYIDKETLNHKLAVRKWKKGDYFYPLGMRGRKMVAKFYRDEKMDKLSRESQWLLCDGDDVIWVIGKRADDRYKVTPATREIVKISLNQ